MAEPNGHQDNVSRLDRIEAALEHVIDEHEMFRDEHKRLLTAQVVLTDRMDRLAITVDEIGGKLNGLIDLVQQQSREFHARMTRLEEKQ